MAEHLGYDSALLETTARDPERHCSTANHGGSWVTVFHDGGEAILTRL